MQDAQKIRYGRGISIVFPGDTEEVIQAREQERDNNYLQKSLQLCTDAALAVDKFAEENPNLTKYSLLAMDVALSGPSRFAMNFCSREIGLDAKIEDYKDQFKGWLSWKVAETAGISPETSEVLVSGGMFGISFGLAMGGIQSKEQAIVGEAKNVKSAVDKIPGYVSKKRREQVTVEIKQAELPKFGVKRKIEQVKADSKTGQNILQTPQRNSAITANKRAKAKLQLKKQGADPSILKKVDIDHTHELQLGGSDSPSNLQFLDKGVNRAIGKRIETATKDFPEGTKIDVQFKVKETGESL